MEVKKPPTQIELKAISGQSRIRIELIQLASGGGKRKQSRSFRRDKGEGEKGC